MKFIKVFLTKGNPIVMQEDKFLDALESDATFILVTDKDGESTGDGFHKSHIVQWYRDKEATREYVIGNTPALDESKESMDINKYKPDFLKES